MWVKISGSSLGGGLWVGERSLGVVIVKIKEMVY